MKLRKSLKFSEIRLGYLWHDTRNGGTVSKTRKRPPRDSTGHHSRKKEGQDASRETGQRKRAKASHFARSGPGWYVYMFNLDTKWPRNAIYRKL